MKHTQNYTKLKHQLVVDSPITNYSAWRISGGTGRLGDFISHPIILDEASVTHVGVTPSVQNIPTDTFCMLALLCPACLR
jgi:hypothetical protein